MKNQSLLVTLATLALLGFTACNKEGGAEAAGGATLPSINDG